MTGIGGQGVQLGAQVLARAAVLEGRHAMIFGTYGGEMRGGNTDSTLVVADAPISTPPIVSHTWGAVVMHHEFWEPTRAKLRPGSVVFLNSTLFEGEFDRSPYTVIEVSASRLAIELGARSAGSMVMVGAVAAATGLVKLESLVRAMENALPSYRKKHVPDNAKALQTGFDTVRAGSAPALLGGPGSDGPESDG